MHFFATDDTVDTDGPTLSGFGASHNPNFFFFRASGYNPCNPWLFYEHLMSALLKRWELVLVVSVFHQQFFFWRFFAPLRLCLAVGKVCGLVFLFLRDYMKLKFWPLLSILVLALVGL